MFVQNSYKIVLTYSLFTISVFCEGPKVITTHGEVLGKSFKTLLKEIEYHGFMGIPYAAPPVKELRFLPPQPLEHWTHVRSVTKEKPACLQFNNNVRKGQPLGHYGAEDCLYLDIYTRLNNNRPIIVFLYNEHFKNSYNKTKDYAPDFFMDENVVVATISHRLSVFGFLSFEDEALEGNSGLKDIVAALKWIRDNADRFGGDRNRITLMGSQGGAAAIDLLIHSRARELFNSVILQSGSAWSSIYLQEDARDRAFKLGKLFDIKSSNSAEILKGLSAISPADLLKRELNAIPEDYSKEVQRSVLPFGPVVERNLNSLITDYPENSKGIDVPVIVGFNSREGIEKSLQYLIEPKYLAFAQKDFVLIMPKRVGFRIDPLTKSYETAVNEVKRKYFPNGKVTIHDASSYITYMGDLFTYNIDYAAKFYANITSANVFYYYFDYYSDLNENKNDLMRLSVAEDGTWGSAAGDELCYLFKCPRLDNKYLKFNKTMSEEILIQRKLVRLWANFARTGNPTPENDSVLEGLQWPTFNEITKQYLHISKHMEIRKELNRFKFWDKFMRKWEKKAVNGIISERTNDEL